MTGRLETPLDPSSPIRGFADGLRTLRERSGRPTYRQLANATGFAASTLARAASGRTLPSWYLTLAYVTACGGDEQEWRARWEAARAALRQPAAGAVRAPAELPADFAGFVGRTEELARLDRLLVPADRTAGVPRRAAVVGIGGVGKTALTVRWAHRTRRQFPDGQLYLNLRGNGPGLPVPPTEAVASMLHSLGVPRHAQPAGQADRIALYRSLLCDRRLLVVLDDAHSAAQVRPLLPGGESCAALVTSRDDLRGLVAIEGIPAVPLPPLDPGDAVALLTGFLAVDRPVVEAEAAREIAARCGYLPLALRIAGALVAVRRHEPISAFLEELRRDPLTTLAVGGDSRAAIRATFATSLAALPPNARELFTVLGLVPGDGFDLATAAALARAPRAVTARLLDRLVAGHLVERRGRDRYGMHDLLRRFAADLAATAERPESRRRMFA